MPEPNHYQTLEVSPTATQVQIKQAYRRLAKCYHPDANPELGDRDRITQINAAYEVLSDPQQRRFYDRELSQREPAQTAFTSPQTQTKPTTGQETDEHLQQWLNRVYVPVNRLLAKILNPLKRQINDLAADPFDDELLENFQDYLEDCRQSLEQAQSLFTSLPNPSTVAGSAVNLYYCLNQVADGIDELHWFTLNYDDSYLHTGQELFRIAAKLRQEAQISLKQVIEV